MMEGKVSGMEILKETERKVVGMSGYRGVCNGCNTPIEYLDSLIVIIVKEFPDKDIVVPIDRLVCPYCFLEIASMTIYKNLDISKEIEGIKK